MSDPTYLMEEINANRIWKLAFFLSEVMNDIAPIGWSQYIYVAEALNRKYEIKERNTEALEKAINHKGG